MTALILFISLFSVSFAVASGKAFDYSLCKENRTQLIVLERKAVDYRCDAAETLAPERKFDIHGNSECPKTNLEYLKQFSNVEDALDNNPFNLQAKILDDIDKKCQDSTRVSYFESYLAFVQYDVTPSGESEGVSILKDTDIDLVLDKLLRNPYLPYEVIESGACYMRERLISYDLSKKGIKTGAVIVQGIFHVVGAYGPIEWISHTAPYLINERLEKMVIDPSLSMKPLTIDKWIELLHPQNKNYSISFEVITDDLIPLEQAVNVLFTDTTFLLYEIENGKYPKKERFKSPILQYLNELGEFRGRW